MRLVIHLAVPLATLGLLSSIPAAGQSTPPPKLSPQQLNPPTPNGNKPIAAPNKPIAAPNKPITVPMAAGTVALQRPVPNRDMKPRPYSEPNANQAPPLLGVNISGPLPGSQPCIVNCN
jgi:hypothetical protein